MKNLNKNYMGFIADRVTAAIFSSDNDNKYQWPRCWWLPENMKIRRMPYDSLCTRKDGVAIIYSFIICSGKQEIYQMDIYADNMAQIYYTEKDQMDPRVVACCDDIRPKNPEWFFKSFIPFNPVVTE